MEHYEMTNVEEEEGIESHKDFKDFLLRFNIIFM